MQDKGRITVEQDLTVHHAAHLLPACLNALGQTPTLVLDLQRIDRIDTAGVQLLLVLQREARSQGGRLRLENLCPEVREVVRFYGLNELMDLH